jgi:hypothetical protein
LDDALTEGGRGTVLYSSTSNEPERAAFAAGDEPMTTNRRSLPTLLACALLASAPTVAVLAQAVRIPRTTITVTPPPGFTVARTFSGLENAATGSKITLVENPPEARAELVAVFASPKTIATRYASQGIRVRGIEQVSVDEGQIPLAIGGKAENGKEVVTYITTMGGRPETNTMAVLITFSIAPMDTLTRADVEATLRSIKLARVPTLEEKVARLTFTFDVVAPFRISNLQDASAVLTSSEGARSAEKTPAIVINRALTRSPPGEIAELSDALMRSVAGFREAQPTEQMPATFAGGQGYFLSATSDDLTLLQLIRVLPGGRYVRFVARGETGALESARDAVMEIAQSVALKE